MLICICYTELVVGKYFATVVFGFDLMFCCHCFSDKSLSYQERLDALRSKCSHMYQKPGSSLGGMGEIGWGTGNWKAKIKRRFAMLPKVPYIDTHCHIDFLFQR